MKVDPRNPGWPDRDRFILSKGHGSLGYYTALTEAGFITKEQLFTFEENAGSLPGQPSLNMEMGIEFSSGSLGMGLALGGGVALAGKKQNRNFNVYVLLGDGECNEGSVWEAAMSASHYHLDNLVAIVDCNKMQSDGPTHTIMNMGDLAAKWSSFGFTPFAVDGHNVAALYDTLVIASEPKEGRPTVVIANTVKGKGVSFMENDNTWHHNRLVQAQYDTAMSELGE